MGWQVLIAWVLLLLGAVRNAWGQAQYTLSDLGPLAGNDAMAVNSSDQVVGGKNFGSGIYNAFLYSGGSMQDLGTLSPSQSYSFANDINNTGQIVGSSQQSSSGGLSYPFIYGGGTMTELTGLGGNYYGSANGINNLGQVVGISGRSDGVTHAFLYSAGTMTDLGSLTGTGGYSDAYAINDHTQVVGVSTNAEGFDRAFLWQNGTMTDLGDLYAGSGNAWAYSINNLGQIVGDSWQVSSSPQAVLWENGTVTDLGPGIAAGINDSGVVVGENSGGMFVWDSADGMLDVNDLLNSSGAGWTLLGCRGINDLGQIVGYGDNPSGLIHGVLLTPTPEPSTLALLAAGATGLLGWALRRNARKAHVLLGSLGRKAVKRETV